MRVAIKIVFVVIVAFLATLAAVRLATGRMPRPRELLVGTVAVALAIVAADVTWGF